MRKQDSFELLQRISLALMVIGVVLLGLSYAWKSLGWEQPTWTEDQQDQFAKAANDYHKLGHRIDPPDDPEFAEKLRVAKAAYEVEHHKLMSARDRGEWTVRGLFFGGLFLTGLGLLGTLAAKQGE